MLRTDSIAARNDMDWNALLPEPEPDTPVETHSLLGSQTVLITGGGGYIGAALARACADQGAAHLVLLDIAEAGLHQIEEELRAASATQVTALLGSAGDRPLLEDIFVRYAPRLVFHAGAYKHVPLAEVNPFAVMQNNAVATATLAKVAAGQPHVQLIMVSTDKAAAPAGIMGASKRIGELALSSRLPAAVQRAVRLGNVLGSPGSVGPLFAEQVRAGQPLTVTDPQVLRYFVSPRRTTAYLLAACVAPAQASLLVPLLDAPMKVVDLAQRICVTQDYPVRYIGLRPGEKLVETLLAPGEAVIANAPGGLQCVQSPGLDPAHLRACIMQIECACRLRDMQALLSAVRIAIPGFRTERQEADA